MGGTSDDGDLWDSWFRAEPSAAQLPPAVEQRPPGGRRGRRGRKRRKLPYVLTAAAVAVAAGISAALVLPGGVANPDNLRMDEKAVSFVKEFAQSGKPVAAICHGPWTLIEAGVVKGHTLTSWPSLKTDLKNAGANWVDKEVVLDGNFITSRKPDDLPAFIKKVIEEIADGKHLKAAS